MLTRSMLTRTRRVASVRKFCQGIPSVQQKLDYAGIIFFSSICIGAGALGTWQVKRYFWKVDLIDSIKKSAADPPATVSSSTQDALHHAAQTLIGRRVLLSGHYDHSKEIFLGMRTAPSVSGTGPAKGMATNQQGYFVITPLVLDNGLVVHVNRGWVSRKLYQQHQQQLSEGTGSGVQAEGLWRRPVGKVSVEAVFTEGEKAPRFSSAAHASPTLLLWLDTAALSSQLPPAAGNKAVDGTEQKAEKSANNVVLAEALVERTLSTTYATATSARTSTTKSPTGSTYSTPEAEQSQSEEGVLAGVVGGRSYPYTKSLEQLQEQSVPPAMHFVYALTWFSLAAAGLFMTYIKFRRGNGKRTLSAINKGMGNTKGATAGDKSSGSGDPAGRVGSFWTPTKEKGDR